MKIKILENFWKAMHLHRHSDKYVVVEKTGNIFQGDSYFRVLGFETKDAAIKHVDRYYSKNEQDDLIYFKKLKSLVPKE